MRNYVLLALLFICLFSSPIFAAGGNLGGSGHDGSAEHPYLIEDFDDFQAFCANTSYWATGIHTRLDCDLDLDPNLEERQVYTTSPIAGDTDTDWDFTGTFDGNDHVIYNLTIDGASVCGLFGVTAYTSIIKNLGLENVSIKGSGNCAGGLVGGNGGHIINCYSTGNVNGDWLVGGLVGHNYYGSIKNCYSTGEVTGEYTIGGLTGKNQNGNITECYSIGEINGEGAVGGLIGDNYYGVITSCYSAGQVTGNDNIGGLVSDNSGSITNCYSISSVTGDGNVGGLVGNGYPGYITNCYSAGSVNGNNNVGGLIGRSSGYNIVNSFWDMETSGINTCTGGKGLTTSQMKNAMYYSGSNWGDDIWTIDEGNDYPHLTWENTVGEIISEPIVEMLGEGTPEAPWIIETKDDFMQVCSGSFFWNKHYILNTNIDLSGEVYIQALLGYDMNNSFKGNLDGNGHIIQNLTIDGYTYLGLFGYLDQDASISNLNLENISVSGTYEYVGSLLGKNYHGNVTNCYSAGQINGDVCAGGLIGENWGGNISGCCSTNQVNGDDNIGGLIGRNYQGYITNSSSTGTVNSSDDYVGGLVGYHYHGSITNSYSTGKVTGDACLGGLAGWSSGNISKCYSTSSVSGSNYDVGGLVGLNESSIENCYSIGNVTSSGNRIGGLVGNNRDGNISNSYSTGAVNGNDNIGGFVGANLNSSISKSFWDVETSGIADSEAGIPDTDGVVGKRTTEMKTQNTFTDAGWDFINTWGIGQEQTYPYLRKYSAADISGDGVVNFVDLAILADNWLEGI
ncbi:MAG TPA: GLUG motif-containing protein [Sedimentisphaerales bacterium]|nr:GLUG motif-containing protein [Sedimentisphaerales bacterium]